MNSRSWQLVRKVIGEEHCALGLLYHGGNSHIRKLHGNLPAPYSVFISYILQEAMIAEQCDVSYEISCFVFGGNVGHLRSMPYR